MTETTAARFGDVFAAAGAFIVEDESEMAPRVRRLSRRIGDDDAAEYRLKPDVWLVAKLGRAGERAVRDDADGVTDKQQLQNRGWNGINGYSRTVSTQSCVVGARAVVVSYDCPFPE